MVDDARMPSNNVLINIIPKIDFLVLAVHMDHIPPSFLYLDMSADYLFSSSVHKSQETFLPLKRHPSEM